MLKRALPLALVALWSPAAFAFPPCPEDPVELERIDGSSISLESSSTPPWFRGYYGLVGDPVVVGPITPLASGDVPASGKCRDRDELPVPGNHLDSGAVSFLARYAPRAGFGVIALPDLRKQSIDLAVTYTLEFTVDNTQLAKDKDWFEIAQLQFLWASASNTHVEDGVSAIYRVRKYRNGRNPPRLQITEARQLAQATPLTSPAVSTAIVVDIPMDPLQIETPISLRWTQTAIGTGGVIQLPTDPTQSFAESTSAYVGPNVDSALEVLGADGTVLYRVTLDNQRAAELSMGLLNYSVERASNYDGRPGAIIGNMRLRGR